jgi:hypothetical protein
MVTENLCNSFTSDGKPIVKTATVERIKKDTELLKKYILVLFYRFIVEMRNTVNKNIMIDPGKIFYLLKLEVNNKVYSIGEHRWFQGERKYLFKSEKAAKNVRKVVIQGIQANKLEFVKIISQWSNDVMKSSLEKKHIIGKHLVTLFVCISENDFEKLLPPPTQTKEEKQFDNVIDGFLQTLKPQLPGLSIGS